MPSAAAMQASSQRRQASAQTRQCSCIEAWRPHSAPQARQASRQARRTAFSTASLAPVRRDAMAAVAAQRSAQSRLRRMHWRRSATCASPRQASVQEVQVCAVEAFLDRAEQARVDGAIQGGVGADHRFGVHVDLQSEGLVSDNSPAAGLFPPSPHAAARCARPAVASGRAVIACSFGSVRFSWRHTSSCRLSGRGRPRGPRARAPTRQR